MISVWIYQVFKVVFATLYPAYASYKAVKTKNVKEYIKWMMYWIVYAFFISVEIGLDFFVAWIPFYYEMKIVFLLWLLSPVTKGSSIAYRKFLHPQLSKREEEIDSCIEVASLQGYSSLRILANKALTLTTDIIVAGASMGQNKLVDQVRVKRFKDVGDGPSPNLSTSSDSFNNDDLMNSIIEASYNEKMKEKSS